MIKTIRFSVFLGLLLLGFSFPAGALENPPALSPGAYDTLIVSGTITNAQGKGVKEAGLHFF